MQLAITLSVWEGKLDERIILHRPLKELIYLNAFYVSEKNL